MRLAGVGKRYGLAGRWLLTGVDLELPGGASVAIEGTNGSGKSTLLRLIAGVSRPSRGTITQLPPVVGYVPDRFPVDRMSPDAYLAHLGRIRGLPADDARRAGRRWLEEFAFVGDPEGPMRALSKGNAQKVALAQALLVPPDLLVLDEPWSGLDAEAGETLSRIVDDVARQGATAVFTYHGAARCRSTVSYALTDGRLHPTPGRRTSGAGAVVDVVLRGEAARPIEWARVTGVVRVVASACDVRIAVRPEASDRLLLHALSNGWSVLEVRSWVP